MNAEAVPMETATESPQDAIKSLRAKLRDLEAKADRAKQNVANLRNQASYNVQTGHASDKDRETVAKAERELTGFEMAIEDCRAELAAARSVVAAAERVEAEQRARDARAAKVAALSQPQTPNAIARLAEAEATLATAQREHSELEQRVAALKSEASKQDAALKRNAQEHAAALVAGKPAPALIPRIDYAEVLKACGVELDKSRQRIATASDAANGARNALIQAEASDAYALLYAALAPVLETLPSMRAHAEQWAQILMVQSSDNHVSLTFYKPHA
jgi:chromosome segregation ATPase